MTTTRRHFGTSVTRQPRRTLPLRDRGTSIRGLSTRKRYVQCTCSKTSMFWYSDSVPQIRIFWSVKYFTCKCFAQSKFCCQTLATKIGIGRRTLHEYFVCLIFAGKGYRRKIFNDENFMIYSMYLVQWFMQEQWINLLIFQKGGGANAPLMKSYCHYPRGNHSTIYPVKNYI